MVIQEDLHRAVDGDLLHRTKKLPPVDDDGVCAWAAYMSYCSSARVIDAIKVGDWLLHNSHRSQGTRGARHSGTVAGRCTRSHVDPALPRAALQIIEKSESRALLEFAGLPRPESNAELGLDEHVCVVGDLVYREWHTVVEYEGDHHQEDRAQYSEDIDRYALFRDHSVSYVQATKERLNRPREFVLRVDRTLRRNGYDGPPPRFGERWRLLFGPLSAAVGPRDNWRAA